ncbi:MAG: ATP-grasp domain-containing protein [Candidatus Bathyarchaeia archaeon]
MAGTIAADLAAAGHKVTIIVGERHERGASFDTVKARYVEAEGEPRAVLRRQLPSHDAAYIIAPESGGTLAELVEMAEELCGPRSSLNQPSSAVRRASDKLQVYQRLRSSGVAVPRSLAFDPLHPAGSAEEVSTLGFPLVLKPSDGAGCEGLTVAFDQKDVDERVGSHKAGGRSPLMAQEYVRGVPASVSMLCSWNDAQPLSLNRQVLLLTRRPGRSLYLGGVVPLDHAAQPQAFQAACRAIEALGLRRGYVGVDMILTRDGPVVVDINPRLTTSYIGLRRTASVNVAEWMVKSCLDDALPTSFFHQGYSIFLKVPVLAEADYTLLEAHGASLIEAIASFRRARSTLAAQSKRG